MKPLQKRFELSFFLCLSRSNDNVSIFQRFEHESAIHIIMINWRANNNKVSVCSLLHSRRWNTEKKEFNLQNLNKHSTTLYLYLAIKCKYISTLQLAGIRARPPQMLVLKHEKSQALVDSQHFCAPSFPSSLCHTTRGARERERSQEKKSLALWIAKWFFNHLPKLFSNFNLVNCKREKSLNCAFARSCAIILRSPIKIDLISMLHTFRKCQSPVNVRSKKQWTVERERNQYHK